MEWTFSYYLEMANYDEFYGIFREALRNRGIEDIPEPQTMAGFLADMVASRIGAMNEPDEQLPIFSSNGTVVVPLANIDNSYETLDVNTGE